MRVFFGIHKEREGKGSGRSDEFKEGKRRKEMERRYGER